MLQQPRLRRATYPLAAREQPWPKWLRCVVDGGRAGFSLFSIIFICVLYMVSMILFIFLYLCAGGLEKPPGGGADGSHCFVHPLVHPLWEHSEIVIFFVYSPHVLIFFDQMPGQDRSDTRWAYYYFGRPGPQIRKWRQPGPFTTPVTASE